jgi:uncharacterized membrane protein YdjX (TVP38/TMEM64 family)
MNNLNVSNRLKKIKPIDIITFLFIIFLISISMFSYNSLRQNLTNEFITFGFFGLFLFIVLVELIPQFIGPHIPIILAISTGLNIHLVIIISLLAVIIGSFLGFYLGKKKGLNLMCFLFREKLLVKILNFWDSYGHFFVLFSALTPLPYFPLIFGSLNMSKKDFIIFGMIPRIIGVIILGYAFYFGFGWIIYLYL